MSYALDPKTGLMTRQPDSARAYTVQDVYGETVNLDDLVESSDQSALRLSAVWACVKVIAESCAALPLRLMRCDDQGTSIVRETGHYWHEFLKDVPHPEYTWQTLRIAFMSQLILRGNGYTWNKWRGGRIAEMEPLLSGFVLPERRLSGRVVYQFATDYNGQGYSKLKPDITHFVGLTLDGVVGLSPIQGYALAAARAQQKHGVSVFEKGTRLTGLLNIPMRVFRNDEIKKQMREEWEAQMELARRGTGTAILAEGTAYQPISMSLADAQFIESQKFSVEEIARIFRVPMHKLNALDRATFNNIELLSREFYTDTLLPWLTTIEAAMNATWLTSAERRAGLCFKHDPREILKGDSETRAKATEKNVLSGVMTRNEARAEEGRPPIEGGDEILVPMNHNTPSEREKAAAANAEKQANSGPNKKELELSPGKTTKRNFEHLRPIIGDTLRAIRERETKALDRARGKDDEGERVEKFLTDHRRIVEQRLAPILDAVRGISPDIDQTAADLAELFVESASLRATGRQIDHLTADEFLAKL